MNSTGNGAMTLSVEEFSYYTRGEKRVSLCFSFTHAIEVIIFQQRERIRGKVYLDPSYDSRF